jgi:hypothetical protein
MKIFIAYFSFLKHANKINIVVGTLKFNLQFKNLILNTKLKFWKMILENINYQNGGEEKYRNEMNSEMI